jgi:uncharacterized protein (TIGR02271 family)
MTGTGDINVLATEGVFDASAATTEIRLADGRILRVPTTVLLAAEAAADEVSSQKPAADGEAGWVIPIVEEQFRVRRRTIETGKVTLRKTVQEFETQLDELLAVRTFDVERVVLNRAIDVAPEVRQEGLTTVYPIVEEQLILTKQLVLKEELRVTQHDSERHDTRPVTLRRELIDVERS